MARTPAFAAAVAGMHHQAHGRAFGSTPQLVKSVEVPGDVHAQHERPSSPHSDTGDAHDTNGAAYRPQSQDGVEDGPPPTVKIMPRSMTIELPNEPIDVMYDHKLSVEDHSPKPCIVPGNALHLIDDDPSPRSQTPSSVIIVSNDLVDSLPHQDPSKDTERSSSEPPPPARPTPRVRFRSRVRITSGVHRHRKSVSDQPPRSTASSSGSGSPSSSISAPIRYHADENATWGPIGRRLSALANVKRPPASPTLNGTGAGGAPRPGGNGHADERTSLVRSGRHPAYVDPYDGSSRLREDEEYEEELLRAETLRRQEEAVFGAWPQRLFNRYVRNSPKSMRAVDCLTFVCSGGGGISSRSSAVHTALKNRTMTNDPT
ncbi:uncharacterized protein LAESUDRAFT_811060 [Laetiporus sulphureus 93-53]|uniref:Uncharacterized protein n=1 Tax=Laetiporus sulphureus 93-53 TaxID=1314785 RepID=A0A165FH51_9APHY|nr:uncharacterized protein LAESUDRAFT_811060 [Laetiporus sulphureus 93-53]KZT08963.1 hypothetical protein LAESUDRAFT_811060 [Laetiporus sulphureus 93-53]